MQVFYHWGMSLSLTAFFLRQGVHTWSTLTSNVLSSCPSLLSPGIRDMDHHSPAPQDICAQWVLVACTYRFLQEMAVLWIILPSCNAISFETFFMGKDKCKCKMKSIVTCFHKSVSDLWLHQTTGNDSAEETGLTGALGYSCNSGNILKEKSFLQMNHTVSSNYASSIIGATAIITLQIFHSKILD